MDDPDDPRNFAFIGHLPAAVGHQLARTSHFKAILPTTDEVPLAVISKARIEFTDRIYGPREATRQKPQDDLRIECLYADMNVCPQSYYGNGGGDGVFISGYKYAGGIGVDCNDIIKHLYDAIANMRRANGGELSDAEKLLQLLAQQSTATVFTAMHPPVNPISFPLGMLSRLPEEPLYRALLSLMDCLLLESPMVEPDSGYPDFEHFAKGLFSRLKDEVGVLGKGGRGEQKEGDEEEEEEEEEEEKEKDVSLLEKRWKQLGESTQELVFQAMSDDSDVRPIKRKVLQIFNLLFQASAGITRGYQQALVATGNGEDLRRKVSYRVVGSLAGWLDIVDEDARLTRFPPLAFALSCEADTVAHQRFLCALSHRLGVAFAVYTTHAAATEVRTILANQKVSHAAEITIHRLSPFDPTKGEGDTSVVLVGVMGDRPRRIEYHNLSFVRPHSHMSRSDMKEFDTNLGLPVEKQSRTVEEFR